MEPIALLTELRALAGDVPDFDKYSPTSSQHQEWLGKAYALIARWNAREAAHVAVAADSLAFDLLRPTYVAKIVGTVHRAIASLELEVPTQPSQVFGPGAVYDFLKTLRELLSSATASILIIDPYLDEQIFDTYLASVSQKVAVRLLARKYSAALKPAVAKFVAQMQMSVEVRVSEALHDRVVFIDDRSCWVLGQSIKDAAKSKPTYLAPLATDAAQLKKADYETIWEGSAVI